MKFRFYTLALALGGLFFTNTAFSQGMAINTTGAAANSSAMMDVSSTTQGMLIPRMTAAQRAAIASPATGLLVYQTDGTAGFYFYQGGWSILGGGAPTGTAGGDLTGTYPNPTISSAGTTGDNIVTAVNASGGGLSGTKLATNSVSVNAMSATGTRNSTTYLRGDNTWATVSGGSGTVTSVSSGVLTSGTTAFTDTVFHSVVIGPTTTPSIFYTFNNAAAATVLTNSVTGSPAIPVYGKVVPQALYATSGTPGSTTFYRGDGQWQTPSISAPFSWSAHASFQTNVNLWYGAYDNNTSIIAGSAGYVQAADIVSKTGTIDSMDYYVTYSFIQGASNQTVGWTVWYDGTATTMAGTIVVPTGGTLGAFIGRVTSTNSFSVTAGHTIAVAFSQSDNTQCRVSASWAFYGH